MGRYLAIMSIVALGVGFYSGLESAEPAMRQTAAEYMDETGMYDFRMLSSLGFSEENIEAARGSAFVTKAEGAFFSEAMARTDYGPLPLMFMSLTRDVAAPVLSAGRMPEKSDECLGDKALFSESDIGKTISISDDNDEDTLELFCETEFVITGLAGSPRYISTDRGSTSLGAGKLDGFIIVMPEAFDGDVFHELLVDCGISDSFTDDYLNSSDKLEPEMETLLNSVSLERYKKLRKEADDELDDARKELDDGWKEYEDGKAEAEKKIADGRKEIEDGRQKLKNSEYRIYQSQKEIEEGMIQLTEAETALEANQQLLDQKKEELKASEEQLSAAIAQMKASADSQEQPTVEEENAIAAWQEAINAGKAEIEQSQAGLDSARIQLEENRIKLEEGQKQITSGRIQIASGYKKLDEATEELDKAEADAQAELEDALEELETGEKDYAEAVTEAEDKLKLDTYCLGRNSNSGCATFKNDIAIVSAAANAFPIFFVIIAALVCVTTMTRMVNEERTQIGTLKALGFSSVRTASKYLLYAGSAAFLGCVFGLAAGMTIIPYTVWYAYTIIYNYSGLELYFDYSLAAVSFSVAVPGIVFVTALACKREMREKPADLMRPKAPAAGKRILLEKIGFMWKRFGFLTKVMLRNAFRRPARVLMMILGIGGCTALMIAGFGAEDSLADVMKYQYGEIFLYDVTVYYDADTYPSAEDASAIWADYAQHASVIWQGDADIADINGNNRGILLRSACENEFNDAILFQDDGCPLPYPKPGEIMLTEGIADTLKLSPGDMVKLSGENIPSVELKVCGIAENYVEKYAYVCPESIENPAPNTGLVTVGNNSISAAAGMRAMDGISYVSCAEDEKAVMEQSMSSMGLIIALVVICSAALAFITVFNLTNINIMERVREIATVKVLGFRKKETAAYVLKENLLLSFLGALIGLPLGKYLHRFLMELIKVEYMRFDIRILPRSYAIGFAATVVFVLAINLLMRGRLENVNMAESLKSVE